MVRNGIARARRYGMNWESSLTAFVVLMFVAAPNFDEHPLIQRILRDDGAAPNERIDRLWEKTSEANWKTVEQDYDASAWSIKPVEEEVKKKGRREWRANHRGSSPPGAHQCAPARPVPKPSQWKRAPTPQPQSRNVPRSPER
jgi:hypothetical protein